MTPLTQTINEQKEIVRERLLPREEAKGMLERDFSTAFPENIHDVVKKLYSKRNENGEPIETLTQVFRRVAVGVAIARLKYILKPHDIIKLTLEKALENDFVLSAAAKYYTAMGERKFFANTPANINASPDISLYVLQYEAHGEIIGLNTHKIWMAEKELRRRYDRTPKEEKEKLKKWVSELKGESTPNGQKVFYPNMVEKNKHEFAMGYYANRIKRKGGLAACGVTNAGDSIEEIEKAAAEIMDATKGSMGMGINTSSIRPYQTPNSDGSTASGPDRFVEKLFCPAGQSIAQGGRRGGAFIELRDSNHPDLTLFLSKKNIPSEPSFPDIFEEIEMNIPKPQMDDFVSTEDYKKTESKRELEIMEKALKEFSSRSFEYHSKQTYLKNYNVSVRTTDNFMEKVERKEWYPASFQGKLWQREIFDFTKPILNRRGEQAVNPLNKEFIYKPYSINLEEFPEACDMAEKQGLHVIKVEEEGKFIQVKQDGAYCFYAPDIFKRICSSMVNSGEPGIQFSDLVERSNANNHMYELNTCNPCGEQNLPAQIGNDGTEFRGICNLTTINASHKDFWNEDGSYDFEKMEDVAELVTEFMDDVTTVTHFPIMAQNSTARRERRNGAGFAGIAEFIAKHELVFGSEESNKLITELYDRFSTACISASQYLARERGVYEIWQGSTWSRKGIKVRNTCMVNQQPTGTMAQLCGTSWGPEPFNGIVFSRKVRDEKIKFTAPGFEECMKKYNAWPETQEEVNNLYEKINDNGKSVNGLDEVPIKVQEIYKINTEIDPIDYIKHLASIQAGVGDYPECFNALSNTCMIKSGTDWKYAWDAVMTGYKLGVKSITFYPDGTRLSQPVEEQEKKNINLEKLSKFIPTQNELTSTHKISEMEMLETEVKEETTTLELDQENITDKKESEIVNDYIKEEDKCTEEENINEEKQELCGENINDEIVKENNIELQEIEHEELNKLEEENSLPVLGLKKGRKRPKRLYGFNEEVMTPEGSLHVHVYFDEKGPRQVFAHLARSGGVTSGLIEATCRMATKALKWGCSPEDVARGLLNIQGGPKIIGVESCSIPDAIGKVLLEASINHLNLPVENNPEDSIQTNSSHNPIDEKAKARMEWIAQGNITQCPVCCTEFIPSSYGTPACKSGPVCLGCGWSHCG